MTKSETGEPDASSWGAIDELDPRSDYWATDAGIDGAGASAEEAAIHVVPDSFPSDDSRSFIDAGT
jgi:hypothetical protein